MTSGLAGALAALGVSLGALIVALLLLLRRLAAVEVHGTAADRRLAALERSLPDPAGGAEGSRRAGEDRRRVRALLGELLRWTESLQTAEVREPQPEPTGSAAP